MDYDHVKISNFGKHPNDTTESHSLSIRIRVAGMIGIYFVFLLVCLLLARAIKFVRRERTCLPPSTATCVIQFCLFFISIFDVPHFLNYLLDKRDERWPLAYEAHVVSMTLIQCSFYVFALLWVEILNLGPRIKKIATIIARSMILMSLLSGLVFIVIFMSQDGGNDVKIQIILAWWIAGTLSLASTFFLLYGIYAQKRLGLIFYGTIWQSQILRQVNLTVIMCTICCYVRALMLVWLVLENTNITPAFLGGDYPHPIVWICLSQIIPYYGLCFIMFSWTATKGRKKSPYDNKETPITDSIPEPTSPSFLQTDTLQTEGYIVSVPSSISGLSGMRRISSGYDF